MRHIIFTMVLLSALSVFGQTNCPKVSDPPSDTPTVLYTARLLGYVWHQRPGTGEPVTDFLKANIQCSRNQYPTSILVGMGDNLAPEYESRFDFNGHPKARVPNGGLFDFSNDSASSAFRYLGYDAMVPGPEDFYFGAEYLRELGNFWNDLQVKDPTKSPKLLASNLVIQTSPVTPKQYEDEEQNYVTQRKDVSAAIPDSVLPWTQTITASVATKTPPGWKAQLCTATNSPVDIDSPPSGCADLATPAPIASSEESANYRFQLPSASDPIHLEEGRSYGFCIAGLPLDNTESGDKRFCKPFQVARPFFAGRQPWLERDRRGTRFVVFGVVDDELRGALSRENAAWGDRDKQHSEIAVIPPDIAVLQSVEAYLASHPAPSGHLVRVLLAQMAPAKAEALAAALNAKIQLSLSASLDFEFDVVLSAADFRRSTGNEVREIRASMVRGAISAPLIIPHPIYLPGSNQPKVDPLLVDPLEAVFIKSSTNSKTYISDPFMPTGPNHQDDFKSACSSSPNLYDDVKGVILARYPVSQYQCAGANMDALKCLTLDAIQKEFNADLAMLQQWNFVNACVYRPQGPISKDIAPVELLESLRRTIWGSSYLTRVTVTGAKLKTVLDTSEKIAIAQKSSTYTSLLHDRDLVYIGVSKKDKTYYVNGQPIDEARIYSIATDDTLAVGNSEYPDMIDSSFAASEIFRHNEAHDTLSPICLMFTSLPKYRAIEGTCPDVIPKNQIMATAGNWAVHDNRAPLGYGQQVHDYVKSLFPSESPLPKPGAAAENKIQNRRIFSLTLQNLAGSFAFSKPNRTDLGVQEVFGGVTNNNVIQAHTEKYSLQDAVRLMSSGAHFNVGVDQETQFGRSRQGSLSGGADSVTLTGNVLLVSPFVEYNLHRWTPRWKVVLRPIDYLSDLAGTQFSLDSANPSTQFNVKVPPRNNLQTRLGGRFERDTTGTSFFEFGYIHRDARNVLSSLTFNPGTPTQSFCSLDVSQSAGTCALKVIPLSKATVPTFGSFQQNGMYWNSMFTIPLLTKLSYVFATDGNLFISRPGHDASPLTRYAASIDNSIKFPILGNLAFAPHYGIFLFENQVQHATLTRTIADVQLTYYFDWHQGLHWWDVLKGKTAQPPAPTAGLAASGFSVTPNILK